jgi:phospholipid N-methyltransferase
MAKKQQSEKITFKEYLTLLGVNFRVALRNSVEYIRVMIHYYSCWNFCKADLALRLMYLFHNPFSISKRFLLKRGEKQIYAYGETPLTSLEIIAKVSGIGPRDTLFELGSGRGLAAFWLNSFIGCKVVGIEYVPEFVEHANRIKNRLKINGVQFRLQDMLKADLTGASVCYLYGTCLDEHAIKQLIEKFKRLPKGTKIITVSYPLSDYSSSPHFLLMKRFSVPFTWGEGDLFVQVIV